jgi:hypothetical protein
MADTPPVTIAPKDRGDANIVMRLFNDLYSRFPIPASRVAGVLSSVITWDASVPSSALPFTGNAAVGNANSGLDSDPMHVLAQGLRATRRHVVSSWPTITGCGWPAPILNGFLVCDTTGQKVVEFPASSGGGNTDLLVTPFTHAFTAGDNPVHAVAVSDRLAHVSCRASRLIRSIGLQSSSSPSTVLNLSSTYSSLGKIYANRFGNYLYVVAKVSGDATYRRLLRVDIGASPVTYSELAMTEDLDIVDVLVTHSDGSASTSLGQIMIAQKDSAAAGGTLFRARESTSGIYGGAFPTAPEGTVLALTGTELLHAMASWRGRAAIITHDAAATTIRCRVVSYNQGASNVIVPMWTSTITGSTPTPVDGGAWSDGQRVYCLRRDGQVSVHDPSSTTGTLMLVHLAAAAAATAYQSPSGGCWTGKSHAMAWNLTASSAGEYGIF